MQDETQRPTPQEIAPAQRGQPVKAKPDLADLISAWYRQALAGAKPTQRAHSPGKSLDQPLT